MADDIKIIVGVEDGDVLKTIKNHQILEKRVEELTKEYAKLDKLHNSGKLSAQSYAKAIQQVDKQINSMNNVLKKGGNAVNDFATGMNISGKAARRNEIAFQQAGYQVQDFIIQVQGGTNPLIAFSQQASQLAGFFAGPWGAMIGLGIAAVSSLAMAFQAVSSSAKEAEKDVMSLADAQGALNEATVDYQKKIDMLTFGVDSEAEAKVLKELITLRKEDERIRAAMAATDNLRTRLRLSEELKENRKVLLEVEADAKSHADRRAEYEALKSQERIAQEKAVADAKRATDMADAERMLGEQMADKARTDSLNQFRADAEATAKTLDAMFRSRTLTYSIRFAGEEDVMSQSLTPSGKMRPAQSYEELLALGVPPERLEAMGLKPKRSFGGGSGESNEEYLNSLLRETELKKSLIGLSTQEAAKLTLLNTLEAKGIDLNDKRVQTLIEEKKNLADLEKAYEDQQQMVGLFKDTLTNALLSIIDGSKSVADAFKSMMRQILSSLAQKSIIQPLVSGLTGGIAGGAAGGLMGGLAGGAGIAATMGTIGSSLGAGFMTSVYGGLAGTAGAVSGGLAVGGAAGIATAIGAVAAPLLAVAAVFSFFKTKTKELDSGIRATVTNMDSYIETFSVIQKKKFFGLSKKVSTNVTPLSADNPVSAAIASVQQSIFNTAEYLGIATDSLNGFSYEFELSLKGLSEEARMQKITEEVNKLTDAFAGLLPNVQNMQHLTDIMNERYSLETRLLEAQGDTEALRARELASTNEYNRSILEQIFAAEDAKAAMDALNNSIKETDFATLLDFNRAQAYARLGMNVANSPEVPSMSNAATSGVQAITSPMNSTSAEVVQLRSEMKEMHKETMFAYSKMIKNGKDSRDTLRSWDVVGLPAERTA